jgi:programmed cell death 6-interacting protein
MDYGEEIARLQDALKCVADGLFEMKGAQGDRAIVDGLTNLKRRLEQDLQRAEKDNGLIYLSSCTLERCQLTRR